MQDKHWSDSLPHFLAFTIATILWLLTIPDQEPTELIQKNTACQVLAGSVKTSSDHARLVEACAKERQPQQEK